MPAVDAVGPGWGDGPRVLVAGATGYVGGRLVRPLLARGYRVRCLARRPEHLVGRVPGGVEVVGGDCLDPASLGPALRGIDSAFYLVHSMGSGGDFVDEDRAIYPLHALVFAGMLDRIAARTTAA